MWPADRLERTVSFLRDHPDTGLVYGDMEVIDQRGEVLAPSFMRLHRFMPQRGQIAGTAIGGEFRKRRIDRGSERAQVRDSPYSRSGRMGGLVVRLGGHERLARRVPRRAGVSLSDAWRELRAWADGLGEAAGSPDRRGSLPAIHAGSHPPRDQFARRPGRRCGEPARPSASPRQCRPVAGCNSRSQRRRSERLCTLGHRCRGGGGPHSCALGLRGRPRRRHRSEQRQRLCGAPQSRRAP